MAVNFVKQNNLKIDWILPSFGVSLCKFIFSKNLLCQTVFLWSEFWVKRHLHKQIPQNRKIQSILWFFCFIKVAAEFPRILLHMKPKVRQIWRFLICVPCWPSPRNGPKDWTQGMDPRIGMPWQIGANREWNKNPFIEKKRNCFLKWLPTYILKCS